VGTYQDTSQGRLLRGLHRKDWQVPLFRQSNLQVPLLYFLTFL
jgi:hypothetical protein